MPIIYGRAGSSETYQRYVMCKTFKWDLYTYEAQPLWFIEELLLVMNQENQKSKQENDKSRNRNSSIASIAPSARRPVVRRG